MTINLPVIPQSVGSLLEQFPGTGQPRRQRGFQYIRIETTNRCNLACTMCPQSTANDSVVRGSMSRELFEKIVTQIAMHPANRGAYFALHICGEPLLHKEIVHFIRFSANLGMKPSLTTNATALTPKISEQLIASGLSSLEFSFEGMTAEIYEQYRVGANYQRVAKNIETFLQLNHEAGHPVRTELVVVDLPQVDAKLKRDFCDSMRPKFDRVNLSGFVDWLGEVKGAGFERKHYRGCAAPYTDLNILYDGRVVPCCTDVYGEMTIGDFRTMDYDAIVDARARQELVRRLKRQELHGLLCDKCSSLWVDRQSPATGNS